MTCLQSTYALRRRLAGISRDEGGAVAIEFAIVVALLFFMLFMLLDFGRIAFQQVMAEKAAHLAARTAVVRPAACPLVPTIHTRGTAPSAPKFGTSCSAMSDVCAPLTFTCAGDAANPTAAEIWARIALWMPADAAIDDLTFTYQTDPNLGFLGGPFTPVVTVEIDLPPHQFISPLGALARIAGAASPALGASLTYANFSVSLPAEDLALGDDG